MRVLEDHLHLATHRTERFLLQVRDVGPAKTDRALRWLEQSQDGATDRRLAAPALSDESENLPLLQGKRDAVDRVNGDVPQERSLDDRQVDGEMLHQVLDLEDRFGHRKSFPKWQEAKCPGRYSIHSGSRVEQISLAYGHRG